MFYCLFSMALHWSLMEKIHYHPYYTALHWFQRNLSVTSSSLRIYIGSHGNDQLSLFYGGSTLVATETICYQLFSTNGNHRNEHLFSTTLHRLPGKQSIKSNASTLLFRPPTSMMIISIIQNKLLVDASWSTTLLKTTKNNLQSSMYCHPAYGAWNTRTNRQYLSLINNSLLIYAKFNPINSLIVYCHGTLTKINYLEKITFTSKNPIQWSMLHAGTPLQSGTIFVW